MPSAAELLDSELIGEPVGEALRDIPIPPCPGIVVSLMRESLNEQIDFLRVARLVGGDVALAASVLRAANSPFFGLRRKVQTVQQAVSVLGLNHLLKIVYAHALRQSLGSGPPMERLWERSHFNAVVCSLLAQRYRGVSAEEAYCFGLFHDAGMAVLMQKFADYKETLALANARPVDPTRIEDERYRTNHVVVGALLARNWYLTADTVWAIRYQHDMSIFAVPNEHATRPVRSLVAMGSVSEHIVAGFLGYPDDAEWIRVRAAVLSYLTLDESGLDRVAESLAPELREIRASRG
jgi:HD-like signal output (HDOD) protein